MGVKVLGVDPGTAATGYGLVERKGDRLYASACGVIYTPSDLESSSRLLRIYLELREIIQQYQPEVVAVEQVFFNRNTKSALAVGQARGIVLLLAAYSGLKVEEFTPLQIKSAVAGYGKADKRQVQAMVSAILGLGALPRPDHASDALATAICCANTLSTQRRMRAHDRSP